METPLIRYNLKDRGRKYRGKERHFNIAAVINAINSPEAQEMVSTRGMFGYYGHLTRLKCGLIPNEGIMDGGLIPKVIPAFVTTHLKGFPDGTIEHKAEFLGTDPGQVAAKLYNSRAGGFSSAIDPGVPRFAGFDYVLEPNYHTNRGYVMDSADDDITLDSIDAMIQDEQIKAMAFLLDAVNAEREVSASVIERLQVENEQLLSLLASGGNSSAHAVLDDAGERPFVVSRAPADRFVNDVREFRFAELPRIVVPPAESKESPESMRQRVSLVDRFMKR